MRENATSDFVIGYSILLVASWLFDVSLKWFLSVPPIVIALIWVGYKILEENSSQHRSWYPSEDEARSTGPPRPRIETQTLLVTGPNPQIEKVETTKPDTEKREAEKSLETLAFPLVEKTLGPQEALEATLDEF